MPDEETAPQPREAKLAVIQEAIDRRRQGGLSPQIQQQTGAAGPPLAGASPLNVLAQRAGGELPTPDQGAAPVPGGEPIPGEAAPVPGETGETPDETKVVMKLLVERLQKLLKTGVA